MSFDLIALSIVLCVLAGYNIVIVANASKGRFLSGGSTSRSSVRLSINLRNAEQWIGKHKEKSDPASVTLAVQTLRNTILVAIFVGGYSFQYALSNTHASLGETNEKRMCSIITSSVLFASFLCWVSVIRLAAQLGYIIGTLAYEGTPITHDVSIPADVEEEEAGMSKDSRKHISDASIDMMTRLTIYFR
jgi:hypothetical protein